MRQHRESLDELEGIVQSKFSGIVNNNVETMAVPRHPHEKSTRQVYKVTPVKDLRSVTLSFPCNDQVGRHDTMTFSWLLPALEF